MNLVGHEGRGESVWLGFFLCEVLRQFASARHAATATTAFAQRCDDERIELRERLEAHGWDGAWYRRAYFDDGTPLGSAANAECQIDSIAQSWSVLSGVGDAERRAPWRWTRWQARLVRAGARPGAIARPAVRPPGPNPGYISGYVPGVRENGGQYTHGAIWAAMAFAALGDRERAWAVAGHHQPGAPRRDAAERRDLQGRALRRGGRRLRRRAAHRTRRLELVHRLGRLDVPADRRVAAGPAPVDHARRRRTAAPARRACRATGRATRSTTATAPRTTGSRSRKAAQMKVRPASAWTALRRTTWSWRWWTTSGRMR